MVSQTHSKVQNKHYYSNSELQMVSDCSAPDVTDSYCNECPSPPPTAAWLPGLSATISAIDDDVMNITFAWDTNTGKRSHYCKLHKGVSFF